MICNQMIIRVTVIYCSSTYATHRRTVYNSDPYDHLITYHPTGRSSCREFGNENWLGFVMQQGPYWHDEILGDRIFNKPVVNGEYAYAGWHEDEDVRKGAWDITTAGGFFTAVVISHAPLRTSSS